MTGFEPLVLEETALPTEPQPLELICTAGEWFAQFTLNIVQVCPGANPVSKF